jgi:hypothetical protein
MMHDQQNIKSEFSHSKQIIKSVDVLAALLLPHDARTSMKEHMS